MYTPLKNRETWLNHAVHLLADGLFKHHSYVVPKVKVSVGFPGGGSAKKRIGEHWSPEASEDKVGSIFISPVLDDSIKVLDVLVHELVHAVVGNKAGHGPVFKKCATKIGLTGKMRSTTAGPELKLNLEAIVKDLQAYPHARLNLKNSPVKKQTTRMLKMECYACGYICRASASAITQHGRVVCPCNNLAMYLA